MKRLFLVMAVLLAVLVSACGFGSDSDGSTGANVTATSNLGSHTYIQFDSATPEIIGVKGTSSSTLPQGSVVKFKVVDSANNGKADVRVNFSLIPETAPGGIKLTPTSAKSDTDGYVATTVTSGTIPTPLWVVATISGSDPEIKSQSHLLTITTGLPTQDFFSLSVETFNIEGLMYDNVTTSLNIIASDRLGNPVPDGTEVNFITEGGHIDEGSHAVCSTVGGLCKVTFRSAEFRPLNGRVTILAYAIGEKSFADANNNNIYDEGEIFYDIGDPYIDNNENGIWDAVEFYIPSTISGSLACMTQPDLTPLPDNYWNVPSRGNSCNAQWGQNYVRRSAVIILSGSYAYITPTTVNMNCSCQRSFSLLLTDVNGNPMPAGTTIEIGTNYVYYIPNGDTKKKLADVTITAGSPVLSTIHPTSFILDVNADCSAGAPVACPSGTVNVVVTTPMGNITTIPITVN
ncbi:MAG TPA: hypothetical protein PLW42_11075 [Anaerohalosphaeraceae bacterium]|nr:hypothetical protein [Smithella sp.]HOT73821.1 hypothetical protein [Anaerohalosphaeraceae bacterium]